MDVPVQLFAELPRGKHRPQSTADKAAVDVFVSAFDKIIFDVDLGMDTQSGVGHKVEYR
jgi:hypothetical protein